MVTYISRWKCSGPLSTRNSIVSTTFRVEAGIDHNRREQFYPFVRLPNYFVTDSLTSAYDRTVKPMYTNVNGARLYYDVLGDGNDDTIMILHGGPGISDHQKGKQAYEPLAEDFELVVYDHRGCGESSLTPPYSNEQYAEDAEALRRHLDLGEVAFIGGSYGGYITQEYAIRYPENLAGFVLRDTAPTGDEQRAWDNARESWDDLKAAAFDIPDITWEEFERVMNGNVRSDEEFERIWLGMLPLYESDIEEFDAEAARESVAELTFHHETHNVMFTEEHPNIDYTDDLPDVDVPALVTVGRNDWITPPEDSREIADLLPDSRLVIFEESGHSPNLDQQDQYLHRVREFFAEIGFGDH
jgi:proline iminopeptidase